MALPSCVKCGGHIFEVAELKASGARYRLLSVQCASCGGVLGVMDYLNTGAQTESIRATLEQHANALRRIAQAVGTTAGL